MATFRKVQVSYWQDDFTLGLTPEEKFFYLYLMTNTKSNQVGCYALPKRVIEFETGYSRETVEKLIQRFMDYGKIEYSEETREILICNWAKYNWTKSPKVFECMKAEFLEIKNRAFKAFIYGRMLQYGYPMDSLSIDFGEEEEIEKEREEEIEGEKEREAEGTCVPSEEFGGVDADRETLPSEEDAGTTSKGDVLPSTGKDGGRGASYVSSSVMEQWNGLDGNIPKIQSIRRGTARHRMLMARIREYGIDAVIQAIHKIADSRFLQGYATDFVITFDWFLKPNNFIKVYEGNYADKPTTHPPNGEEAYYRQLQEWAMS